MQDPLISVHGVYILRNIKDIIGTHFRYMKALLALDTNHRKALKRCKGKPADQGPEYLCANMLCTLRLKDGTLPSY